MPVYEEGHTRGELISFYRHAVGRPAAVPVDPIPDIVKPDSSEPAPMNYNEGGYLKKKELPKDPWGRDYIYRSPGDHGNDYEIMSLGADGRDGGEGVNADNIRQCLEILRDGGFTGTLSMECEGQGGPLIEKSLAWLRGTLKELNIPEETGL